ncbi:MAG: Na+/H+ antiporter NhaC family protein [Sedimentisphaerales bacterium]
MSSKKFIKSVLIVITLGLGCAVAIYLISPGGQNPPRTNCPAAKVPDLDEAGSMATGSIGAGWYSVVPPIIAILLSFLTRHVLLSLGIAIVVGGLLAQVPQAPLRLSAWLDGLKTVSICVADTINNKTNLQILSFIPPIFVMIEVIIAAGGFKGVILWGLKWVKGRRSAQAATAVMGILCFIDDYANAIIVGSMMQPITDRFRVSREKLAFLVDATSAPISGLAIVSTWIAYEVGLFTDMAQKLGIEKSGYSMFFDALSFRFYCLLMIAFVFLHILMGRDFGPMKTAEKLARRKNPIEEGQRIANRKGQIANRDKRLATSDMPHGRAVNALLPLGGLILFHIIGLWIDGNGPAKLAEGGSLFSWVYWREVISNARNSHLILLYAAVFGMTLALACGRIFGLLRLSIMCKCFGRGIKRAMMPFAILILAWSLKNCCDTLKTGEFLTTILAGRVSPHWFGPILFLVASLTSFATGTSWGTMAILIPTAIPIAFALDGQTYGLTTMISLAAVLDGAIFGDHCSPISDTTIISSTASSCELIQHVRTQLPYSLCVAGAAFFLGYLPSAFGLAPGWSMVLAVLFMLFFLLSPRQRLRGAHTWP